MSKFVSCHKKNINYWKKKLKVSKVNAPRWRHTNMDKRYGKVLGK